MRNKYVTVTIIHDPDNITKPEVHKLPVGSRLMDWLIDHYGHNGFVVPTVIHRACPEKGLVQIDLKQHEADGYPLFTLNDIIIEHRPQGIVALFIGAVVLGAAIAYLFTPTIPDLPPPPGVGEQAKQSPNNSVTGQTNITRLGDRIPDIFGRNRVYPDLIARPYFEYINHIKHLTEFMCIGTGQYATELQKKGDVLITSMPNVTTNIFGPCDGPSEVLTVIETDAVEGQTLPGPNALTVDFTGVLVWFLDTSPNHKFQSTNAAFAAFADLEPGDFISVLNSPVLAGDLVTGSSDIGFIGATITSSGPDLSVFAPGAVMSITSTSNNNIQTVVKTSTPTLLTCDQTKNDLSDSAIPETFTTEAGTSAVLDSARDNNATYTFSSYALAGGTYTVEITGAIIYAENISTDMTSAGTFDFSPGPFLVPGNPQEIWIDLQNPRGLYKNTTESDSVEIKVTLNESDSSGTITGPDEIHNETLTGATLDSRFWTFKYVPDVIDSFYVVTIERTSDESTEATDSDLTKWTRLAGVVFEVGQSFGNVTTVEVNTIATFGATSGGQRNFNMVVERKLPTYDLVTSSINETIAPTSKFADAMLYMLRNDLHGNLDVSQIDLEQLYTIQSELDNNLTYPGGTLGRFCRTLSDQSVPVAKEVAMIGSAARVLVYRQGDSILFNREEAKTVRSALISRRKKKPGTEQRVYTARLPSDPDGVSLTWSDEAENKQQIIHAPGPFASSVPKNINAAGIRNFDQAWNRAQYELTKLTSQRVTVTTEVFRDGLNVVVGDRVGNSNDTLVATQAGEVTLINESGGLFLTTSEKIDFNGAPSGLILFTGSDGSVSPGDSTTAEPTADPNIIEIVSGFNISTFPLHVRGESGFQVGSLYHFFAETTENDDYVIQTIEPKGDGFVRLTMVNYIPEISDSDAAKAGFAGQAFTWGRNSSGGLGLDDLVDRDFPFPVNADLDWSDIQMGDSMTIALKSNREVYSTGENNRGTLAVGDTADRAVFALIAQDAGAESSSGKFDSIGLKDSSAFFVVGNGPLYSAGLNSQSNLAVGDLINKVSTTRSEGCFWQKPIPGGVSNFGIKKDKTLHAWGRNSPVGINGTDSVADPTLTPTQVGQDADWFTGASFNNSTLMIKTDRSLWAWGIGGSSQLGLSPAGNFLTPTQVGLDADWVFAATNGTSSAAIKAGGTLWTTGLGGDGLLGHGDLLDQTEFTQVGTDTDWSHISIGTTHVVAIKGGRIYVWGLNTQGALGIPGSPDLDEPTLLAVSGVPNSGWIHSAAGFNSSAAITTDQVSFPLDWVIRRTPADNDWQAVTYSPSLTLFAAVSNTGTGNRVMTSPNGVDWELRVSAADNDWRSVVWSPELELFVAVSASGTDRIMTSADGFNWTIRTSAFARVWISLAWSSSLSLFVAVADGRLETLSSADGITWVENSTSSNRSWRSVAWSDDLTLFVAVSLSSTITATSPDGINWTDGALPVSRLWQSIAWSPELGIFCAVSEGGGVTAQIATSADGFAWTSRDSVIDNNWQSIEWLSGVEMFVVVGVTGTGTRAMTSYDGTNWTVSFTAADNDWNDTAWSPENSVLVAVGSSGTDHRVQTVGEGGLLTSDGEPYTLPPIVDAAPLPTDAAWRGVEFNGGLFVAVAISGANRVATSIDGLTWTNRNASQANSWNDITYGNGLFVAVSSSGANRVMTSPDGITWDNRNASQANTWLEVVFGGGLFVAVSTSGVNQVMTSSDGITWTNRASIAKIWQAIGYGNGLFVAVSPGGAGSIMTSPNGTTWTSRDASHFATWESVTYGNGVYVAVGQGGNIMSSTDGVIWTTRTGTETSNWRDVIFANGRFFAVASSGTKRIMSSSNGITWRAYVAAEDNGWRSSAFGSGVYSSVSQDGVNRAMVTTFR